MKKLQLLLVLLAMLSLLSSSAFADTDSTLMAAGGGWVDGVYVKILDVSSTDPGSTYPGGNPEYWAQTIPTTSFSGTVYVRVWVKSYYSTTTSPPTLHANGFRATLIDLRPSSEAILVYNGKSSPAPPQPHKTPSYMLYKFALNTRSFFNGLCDLHATVNYTPNSIGDNPAISPIATIDIQNGTTFDAPPANPSIPDPNAGLPRRVIIAYENIKRDTSIDLSANASAYKTSLELLRSNNNFNVYFVPTTLDASDKISRSFRVFCENIDFTSADTQNIINTMKTLADEELYLDYIESFYRDIPQAQRDVYSSRTPNPARIRYARLNEMPDTERGDCTDGRILINRRGIEVDTADNIFDRVPFSILGSVDTMIYIW